MARNLYTAKAKSDLTFPSSPPLPELFPLLYRSPLLTTIRKSFSVLSALFAKEVGNEENERPFGRHRCGLEVVEVAS
jgi:hypothetical protein